MNSKDMTRAVEQVEKIKLINFCRPFNAIKNTRLIMGTAVMVKSISNEVFHDYSA